MDSILITIKKMLGITEDYTHFDQDIIVHINSVFLTLKQIGVSPDSGDSFYIEDDTTLWSDFSSDDRIIHAVKPYIYYKVRLAFDPPTNSSHIEAINKQMAELEWRLNSEVDYN